MKNLNTVFLLMRRAVYSRLTYSRSTYSRSICFLLLLFSLTSTAVADAIGATDSIEIIKLTEIISQMSRLLEQTEYLIDVQESVEKLQEKSLSHKSSSYVAYLQLLGGLIGDEAAVGTRQLTTLIKLDAAMRELATRTTSGKRREGLYLIADSFRLLIDAGIILETSSQALQEASTAKDFNSQDQLLASIQRTLALMHDGNTKVRYNRNIKDVANQNMLFGSFNVFSSR